MFSWFPVRLASYVLLVYAFINLYNFFPVFFANTFVSENMHENENIVKKAENKQINIATPTKIIIPKIGVETKVLPVGKTFSGNMEVPNSLKNVGWYKFGSKPGEEGNAVIAGHEVDELGFGAIFKNLHLLKPGDEIFVENVLGEKITFVVQNSEIYNYNNAPLQKIFGDSIKSNLNLITCEGNFISKLKTKDQRLVVFTSLKE